MSANSHEYSLMVIHGVNKKKVVLVVYVVSNPCCALDSVVFLVFLVFLYFH